MELIIIERSDCGINIIDKWCWQEWEEVEFSTRMVR